jgi:DNA polymerase III delta subunit
MNLKQLKTDIKNNCIQSFYFFIGEEVAIRDIFIDDIAKAAEAKIVRAESVESIKKRVQGSSLFNVKTCYVITDDKEFVKEEKNWEDWESGKLQGNNIVILVYNGIDKRGKLYKHFTQENFVYETGTLVDFTRLSADILMKYVAKEVTLSEQYALKLITLCENDYSKILMETNKISSLANATNTTDEASFARILAEGLIYQPVGDIIFNFTDAVCAKNASLSYDLWNKLQATEPAVKVLSILYNNFRNMLSLQLAGNVKNICEFTGLKPFQIGVVKSKLGIFTNEQLIETLKLIRWTEKGIKIGDIEEPLAVNYIMTKIFAMRK